MRVSLHRMILITAAGFLTAASAIGATPVLGDCPLNVVRALGEPRGELTRGDYRIYVYPRGRVVFRKDRVSSVDLLTVEAHLAREARKAEEDEARSARRAQEGKALRAATLGDSAFRALPARDRLAFWRRFAARYPEVTVRHHILLTTREIENKRRERALDRRISALERRAALAEFAVDRAPAHTFRTIPSHLYARPPGKGLCRRPVASPTPPPKDPSLRARVFREYEENRRAAHVWGAVGESRRAEVTAP